jgi:hypothetical protein
MPNDGLDAAAMRRAVEALRRGRAPAFASDRYRCPIHPSHLATPAARGRLWRRLARLAELDRDA